MKREVAGKTGNFRRVCPKKRAKADFLSKLWLGYCTACGVNPVKAEAPDPESGFLFETVETPDNMFSESDALSHKGVQLRKATK